MVVYVHVIKHTRNHQKQRLGSELFFTDGSEGRGIREKLKAGVGDWFSLLEF